MGQSADFAPIDPIRDPVVPQLVDLPRDNFYIIGVGNGVKNVAIAQCDISDTPLQGVRNSQIYPFGPLDTPLDKPFLGVEQLDEFRIALTCPGIDRVAMVDFSKPVGLRFQLLGSPGEAAAGRPRRILRVPNSISSQLSSLGDEEVDDDRVCFATVGSSGVPMFWDSSGHFRPGPKCDGWLCGVAISESHGFLFTGGKPPFRSCFDLTKMGLVSRKTCEGEGDLYGMDIDDFSDLLFITRYNGTVCVCSARTNEHVNLLTAASGMQDVVCVPEKRLVCALGNSGNVLCYDVRRTDACIWHRKDDECFPGAGNYSSLVRFPESASGKSFILGQSLHGTSSTGIWDIRNGKPIDSSRASWTRAEGGVVLRSSLESFSVQTQREDEEERIQYLIGDLQAVLWVHVRFASESGLFIFQSVLALA